MTPISGTTGENGMRQKPKTWFPVIRGLPATRTMSVKYVVKHFTTAKNYINTTLNHDGRVERIAIATSG